MDEINRAIDQLRQAICSSQIYQEYRHQEHLLSADPELKARVDQFRERNFRLQNEASGSDLIRVAGEIYLESKQLRKNPQVNAYLDAELALCKLIQKTIDRLCVYLDFSAPMSETETGSEGGWE